MSIAPITLTGSATRGISAEEVATLKRDLAVLYAQLHPREGSQPDSEIYGRIKGMSTEDRLRELGQLYQDLENVLTRYKVLSREKERKEVAYVKDARKATHGMLVKAATTFLNDQRLEGIVLTPSRGAPLQIVRADVLYGTNDDPAVPLSSAIAAITHACAAAGVQLPGDVIAALPHYFADMRAAMSSKPAVIKKQRA